ncbi:TIGR03668 family PPOX class F420-dependent oxidoreductase [Actinobacteria bacterium YIM 96077]|uniref:TIGR03668 family PPOX class F420-dependent oxidoreductase n=1 Tax=Phytoactinopolyspora halophila TaxID=1981511 RepID=A0A329QPW2_9ACTN|nr:TIGR03668 family PPOX class F420-dependent oxidoreductase [Phytoactinopolyspora halophila]AYY15028.1 TIGR03668 family PPOX class F420-dependent oxidoreductase [Actinobacteria bacterium YIM 96077]RAW14206.1 TIGR03668 family PPOX class F420-dependent oxidoreductase [Phytoactinopolyspora halophila]
MRLSVDECRRRASAERVARLATVGDGTKPHIVPVTFVVEGDRFITGVDQKPKSTTRLRRLRNIVENPQVAVLWDHYDDDWSQLWWVRADGHASVVEEDGARDSAADLLTAKYAQYAADPPRGPVIVVEIDSWLGWAYGE